MFFDKNFQCFGERRVWRLLFGFAGNRREIGFFCGEYDKSFRFAFGYGGTGERHIVQLIGECLFGKGKICIFLYWYRFSCEDRFIDDQACCVKEAYIGRYDISFTQNDDISGYKLSRGDGKCPIITLDLCPAFGQFPECFDGCKCFDLLPKSDG